MAKVELEDRPIVTMDDLRTFFEAHCNDPGSEDEFYFLDYKFELEEGEPDPQTYNPTRHSFHGVFSSQRLLRNVTMASVLHCDATYKLLWQNFPLLIIGVTDKCRSFHPVAFCLSSNETAKAFEFFFETLKIKVFEMYGANLLEILEYLQSDAADAIKKAFNAVFPGKTMLTCWFHVKKNISKRPLCNPSSSASILQDIDCLQLCPNQLSFQKACRLFEQKWVKTEAEFVEYFKNIWLCEKNMNWYEGCAPCTPKTNNALESFNGRIKKDFLFHNRFPLNTFAEKMRGMIATMSMEYRNGLKKFTKTVSTDEDLWKKGLEWAKSAKAARIESKDDDKIYYVPAKDILSVNDAKFNQFLKQTSRSFDTFVAHMLSIWIVTIPNEKLDFPTARCTCPAFLKQFKCKHIVGMGLRLHLVELPEKIKVIEEGKQRGRPRKATSALHRE